MTGRPVSRDEVVGVRLAEVLVAMPDKPVSMSDMSTSAGYVRLENGVVLDLGARPPLHTADEVQWRGIVRDRTYEKEFRPAIGRKVVDVLFDEALLYIVLEDKRMISIVPAQFWVRPCLEGLDAMDEDARSVW